MKSIASVVVIAVVVACAMAMAPQTSQPQPHPTFADPAATYEHLATAIIAIRETENSLVHGMLVNSLASARMHLDQAAEMTGADRKELLEIAATEISNVANEGDKSVQAVRQRLLKAGHHHHTDAETEDDYLFIDGREKSALLALAGEVARMHQASPDDIRAVGEKLSAITDKALTSE